MPNLDRFTRNLDWNLLKYFVQIAQSGGIGAAADSLNISQPSVSVALRRLEEQLGAQLCIRTRKGIQLTGAGKLMLAHCELIVDRLSGAPGELRASTGMVGGSVLLKTISHVYAPGLDAGLVAFKANHPGVELVVESAPSQHIVESLLNGETAVAIGFDEVPRPELSHALLTRERLQLYCGPSHKLAGRRIADVTELADEPFIAFSEGEPPALLAFRARHGLGRRAGGFADNVFEASWLIGLGIGIGILPEPMAAVVAPHLSPLLPPDMVPELDIYLMWRPDLSDRAARLLVETIVEHITVEATCGK